MAFRMGHKPHDIAGGIDDRGDVMARPVGIIPAIVTKGDVSCILDPGQNIGRGEKRPVLMGNGKAQRIAALICFGKRGRRVFNPQGNRATDKAQGTIANQGTGQKSGFGQYLKAIADAKDEGPAPNMVMQAAQGGASGGNGPGTQIIAPGKPPRNDEEIGFW